MNQSCFLFSPKILLVFVCQVFLTFFLFIIISQQFKKKINKIQLYYLLYLMIYTEPNRPWTALSSGPASRSKNCKTPFFSRYSKFLSMGNWYRSRTSPKNFLKKNSNKYSRQNRPKFWPKWAVAGRLIEQQQKF